MMDKIAIILPVRNNKSYRADRLKICLESWKDKTEGLSDMHIIIDEDEVDDFKYLFENKEYNVYVAPTQITLMQKINMFAVDIADSYRFMAFVGDDIIFKTPWESEFISYLSSVPAGLAYCNTNDAQRGRLATHPVITTNMIKAVGFYGCPAVHHNFFDNFWMQVCLDLGYIGYNDAIIWDHSRFGWTPDSIYNKVMDLLEPDSERFRQYMETSYKEDLQKIKNAVIQKKFFTYDPDIIKI